MASKSATKKRIVKVPDIPGPKVQLCWKQSLSGRYIMSRCDRRKGHKGLHTWELLELVYGK